MSNSNQEKSPQKVTDIINENFYFENKVQILRGNLLDQDVNVIVNPANTRLLLGGGVAGAIRERCGSIVQDECDKYLRKRGTKFMNVSEVMHTSSKNTKAKYIIHACGPRWDDYPNRDKNSCFEDLKNTFFNVLVYAENKLTNCESIAIPLISSGIFGVPRNLCCKAVYDAIQEFLATVEDSSKQHIKQINLANIDKETTNDLIDYFNSKQKPVQNETSNYECVVCKGNIDPKKESEFKNSKCKCFYHNECFENVKQNDSKCVNMSCKDNN